MGCILKGQASKQKASCPSSGFIQERVWGLSCQ